MNCPNCKIELECELLKYHKLFFCKTCNYSSYESVEICCSNPMYNFKRYQNSGGEYALRKQCDNCGFRDSRGYSKKYVSDFDNLKIFDLEFEKKRNEEIKEEYNHIQDHIRRHFYDLHKKYFNSDEWKTKRDLVLKRDNYICQSCLRNKATQIHLLSYSYFQNEPLFILTSTCNECHEIVTQIERLNRDNKSFFDIKKIQH